MQDNSGNIRQSIRDNRMRQSAIVTALILVSKGLATIVSSKKFSTQNWRLVKHQKSFLATRPKIISEIEKVFKQ